MEMGRPAGGADGVCNDEKMNGDVEGGGADESLHERRGAAERSRRIDRHHRQLVRLRVEAQHLLHTRTYYAHEAHRRTDVQNTGM